MNARLKKALAAQWAGTVLPSRVVDNDTLASFTADGLRLTAEERTDAERALAGGGRTRSKAAARAIAVSIRLHQSAAGMMV